MKFTVLTPALFAALAASANAMYSLTNAETCHLAAGEFVCHGLSSETTCNADSGCEWTTHPMTGDQECTINELLQAKLEEDEELGQEALMMSGIFETCQEKTEADCTGDCVMGPSGCVPTVAKATSTLTASGAPEAFAKMFVTYNIFENDNCFPKTTEETCGSGCSWDADPGDGERNCLVSDAKIIGEVSSVCGSNGSWEAAAANAGTTLADAQCEAAETSTDSSACDSGNSDTTNAGNSDTTNAGNSNTTNAGNSNTTNAGNSTTVLAEVATEASGSADSASRFAVLAASAIAAASLLA